MVALFNVELEARDGLWPIITHLHYLIRRKDGKNERRPGKLTALDMRSTPNRYSSWRIEDGMGAVTAADRGGGDETETAFMKTRRRAQSKRTKKNHQTKGLEDSKLRVPTRPSSATSVRITQYKSWLLIPHTRIRIVAHPSFCMPRAMIRS